MMDSADCSFSCSFLIRAFCQHIIDPVIDEFGYDCFQLTYGFCSVDLKRWLAKKDPVTGIKNGVVSPNLDQHMAHEINRNGKYYCDRLGAACDFRIVGLESDRYFQVMPRKCRELLPNYCHHITTRCNNREFRLTRFECREVLLFAIKKCQEKFGFKLYALCIMSNHVHYLLEPQQPEDLPKIMHWLNWYTAMCFNRMLNRTGHFWEKRYHSTGFPVNDKRRALNTLRYIHGNPKAANMQQGWFYDFSNYGSYDRLTQDGISQWHPAFLALGTTLEICAAAYRKFCKKYKPQPKPERRNHWGSKLLANIKARSRIKKKVSPGQKCLWEEWEAPTEEIRQVSEKFVMANCFDPKIAGIQFEIP